MFVKSIRWGSPDLVVPKLGKSSGGLVASPGQSHASTESAAASRSQRTGWSAGQVLLNRIQTNPRNPGQNPAEAKPVAGILARILLKIQSKPESSSKSSPESFPTERHKDRTESSPKS